MPVTVQQNVTPLPRLHSRPRRCVLQIDFKAGPVPKRASCQILARHPQAPYFVPVICKQLTGKLLLERCGCHLQIKADCPGYPLLTPAEFEAAAGCSKGKNWKVKLLLSNSSERTFFSIASPLPGLQFAQIRRLQSCRTSSADCSQVYMIVLSSSAVPRCKSSEVSQDMHLRRSMCLR